MQTVLLQEKDLMPQVMQKVAAIFLMYEAHRPEPLTSNPLAPFLAELVQVQGWNRGHMPWVDIRVCNIN